jgi:GTP-binding protein
MIADVGLVGFPNAGKSTLLSHVSDAKPKIGEYPFTTLSPNLGVVRLGPSQNMVLADLPGLIEGAHEGAGLGHDFLRHVERTRLLLHLLDAAAVDGRDPLEDFRILNRELRLHSPQLARTPQLIVLNKLDLPDAQANLPRLTEALKGKPVFKVSGVTGEGLSELMAQTYAYLQDIRRRDAATVEDDDEPEAKQYRPKRPGLRIYRQEGALHVESNAVRRLVVMTDLENPEALWMLHRRLTRMGLIRALERAGAQEGDTIHIGDIPLVFSAGDHPFTFAEYLAEKRQAPRRQSRDEHLDERDADAP